MQARRRQLAAECDKKDTSTWTSEWLTNIFLIDNECSPVLIKNLFGWNQAEWLENVDIVLEELGKQGIKDLGLRAKIPNHGDQRIAVETALKSRNDHRFELPHVRNDTAVPSYILPDHINSGLVKQKPGAVKPASAYQYLILVCCRWGRARARLQAAELELSTSKRKQHAIETPRDEVKDEDPEDGKHSQSNEGTPSTDVECAVKRHHETKHIHGRIGKDHITLCVAYVVVPADAYLTINIKRYQLKDFFDEQWKPVWETVEAAIKLRSDDLHIFCFNNGRVWSIDNAFDFRGQTNDLWLKMDTELCNTAISIFVAERKDFVEMLPEEYQRIEVLSEEEITLDIEDV